MIQGFWGRKIGMTQVFSADNKVVPVTAVDASGWYVSQIKTMANDGYNAVQVALIFLRKKKRSMLLE
jgi:large subunit ribosomal protein L3